MRHGGKNEFTVSFAARFGLGCSFAGQSVVCLRAFFDVTHLWDHPVVCCRSFGWSAGCCVLVPQVAQKK